MPPLNAGHQHRGAIPFTWQHRQFVETFVGNVSLTIEIPVEEHGQQNCAGKNPQDPPRTLCIRGQECPQCLDRIIRDDGVARQHKSNDAENFYATHYANPSLFEY